MCNGICGLAYYSIPSTVGDLLFEALIEDDGACIHLKTPYDHRDGEFTNLDECVTDDLLLGKRMGYTTGE
jgi:hypothetical protein